MKNFFAIASIALGCVDSLWAANIAVIDSSSDEFYLQSIASRTVVQRCFSVADLLGTSPPQEVGDDPNVFREYRYFRASGCPNATESDTEIGPRTIVKRELFNPAGPVFHILSDDHLANVSDIALQYTDQSLALLSTAVYVTPFDGLEASPSNLKSINSLDGIIRALEFVLANHDRYSIRVINLSLGTEFYEGNGYCDDVLLPGEFDEFRFLLNQLNRRGIALVASAGNSVPSGVDTGQEFPSCLSYVVSVGGFTQTLESGSIKRELYGATSLAIDYVDDPYPVSSAGDTLTGTSYAAPKVSAVISRMMAVNPSLSTPQILSNLRSTADSTGKIYYPNNPDKYDTNRLVINPNRAIGSAIDGFWREIYRLILGTINETVIGWNTGTNSHENGAQFRFASPPSNKALGNASSSASPQVVKFSYSAYDIDTADELEILVNGKSYGYAGLTASNTFGSRETVCIDLADTVSDGTDNVVLLRLKETGETWAVKDVVYSVGESDAQCKTTEPPQEPDPNEKVSLVVGSIDNREYGLNYGRNKSVDELEINFTPIQGQSHTFSWRAYDVSSSELKLYLNDVFLKEVNVTNFQQLGSAESIVIPVSKLSVGKNTITFKADVNSTLWGVTDLLLEPIALAGEDSIENLILLNEPAKYGSGIGGDIRTDFQFEYTPRAPGYLNQVRMSVDTFVKHSSNNGFRFYLNGSYFKGITPYLGSGLIKPVSALLPSNLLVNGENTITVEVVLGSRGKYDGAWFEKMEVRSTSTPLFDLAAVKTGQPRASQNNSMKTLTALVQNLGPRASAPMMADYFVSSSPELTAPVVIASAEIAAIATGGSREIEVQIDASMVENGSYIWACVRNSSSDINSSNNCSSALKVGALNITPLILLLLDD